eukprot:m.262568 g.262568  ORF g.262568 m.262568 type:complete len:90 (+) comp11048_c0_seq6:3212-3481(+)
MAWSDRITVTRPERQRRHRVNGHPLLEFTLRPRAGGAGGPNYFTRDDVAALARDVLGRLEAVGGPAPNGARYSAFVSSQRCSAMATTSS